MPRGARGPGGPGTGRPRRRLALLAAAVAAVPLAAGAFALLRTGEDPAAADGGPPSARVSGAVPADSDVPRALRPVLTRAALQCSEDEVTPAFLAAMLKAGERFRRGRQAAGDRRVRDRHVDAVGLQGVGQGR
ncbi:hypothetical protein [Streptomyces sp. AA1529]|uniref:hypothetical protein n=1 Tax=Streptomyces sp. AA1529 TaxID=1203257 RepID=UPI003D7208A5